MPVQYKSNAMPLIIVVICLKFYSIISIHLILGTVQIHFEEWFSHILFTYSNSTFDRNNYLGLCNVNDTEIVFNSTSTPHRTLGTNGIFGVYVFHFELFEND